MPRRLYEEMMPCADSCLLQDLHLRYEMEKEGLEKMTPAQKNILRVLESLANDPNKRLLVGQRILTQMFEANKLLESA